MLMTDAEGPGTPPASSPNTFVRVTRSVLTNPGLWAAALALFAQRLLHGAYHQAPFAPFSIAEWVIRKTPGPLATEGIERLGHSAQPLLANSMIVVALLAGLLLGRRPGWLLATFAFALTLIAAWLDPLTRSVSATFASAALAGFVAFTVVTALGPAPEWGTAFETNWARRRLLARVSIVLVMLGVGGAAFFRGGSRSTPTGPVRADEPVRVPNDPGFVAAPGQSPKVTPTDDHYTVDIDIENPLIGESSWRLKVDGAVENELTFTLDDLRGMQTVERLYNMSCISNQVGGSLISNSRWTGVALDDLLDMAVVRPEAVTLLARSYDGFDDAVLLDDIRGRGAFVAIGMNGMLLPRDHGFPARMLFPNHYGMRSVKWLTKITLLDQDQEGYWAQRGWDRDAVVRTESRIDTPDDGQEVRGPFVVAGVAWAGARGISGVEVSPDDGETWQAAQLETELSSLSWRRWQVELDLPSGGTILAVRATDGAGMVQDAQKRDPHPSGASGYHRVFVRVA